MIGIIGPKIQADYYTARRRAYQYRGTAYAPAWELRKSMALHACLRAGVPV